MPSGSDERYDFFLSRRGSVAAIAREVTNVLKEKGYKVNVEDYDFRYGASFVEAMHEGIKNSRDLLILYAADYETQFYTRKEFTSFVAEMAQNPKERHIIILRCEDVPLRGLLSDIPFQDLVGVLDAQERKRRIIAAAERQSQAAPPPPRPFIGVPPRIAKFTGRADELDRLDAILMKDKPAAVTQVSVGRAAVQGMGGVGKTSLAIEYAHQYRNLYAGVCWCPAETRVGLLSALATLAVTLGAATEEADVEKAAKAALRRLAEQRATWLLVYDNVTAPDHIADFLPSAGARVLITSRFSDWSELADEVELDVLPLEEAVTLLQSRTGRGDAAGATVLAEALGCLPLALDHAAAYCKRTQMRFGDYAKKASSLIAAAPRGAGYPRSVAATFDLAITEAVGQCPATEGLMAYLAKCASERIPMTLVEGAVEDDAERQQALAALAELSLVKHDPFDDGTAAITLHRLVQAVGRARSEANGLATGAAERFSAQLLALRPEGPLSDPDVLLSLSQLAPHVLAWHRARPETGSNATQRSPIRTAQSKPRRETTMMLDASIYERYGLECFSAHQMLYDLAARTQHILGPGHTNSASSLETFARLHLDNGDYRDAWRFCKRALEIRENTLGSDHPVTNRTRSDLLRLMLLNGFANDALDLAAISLATHDKRLGSDHPWTKDSARVTADALDALGRMEEAKALREQYGLTDPDKPKAP